MAAECELCDDATASIQCNECDQEFCNDCDRDMHKPVKMQSHKRSPIGAATIPVVTSQRSVPPTPSSSTTTTGIQCDKCVSSSATAQCSDCDMKLCSKCNIELHKASWAKSHKRSPLGSTPLTPATHNKYSTMPAAVPIPIPSKSISNIPQSVNEIDESSICELCDDVTSTLHCNECDQDLCDGCDRDLHKPAKMQSHHRVQMSTQPHPHPQSAAVVVPEPPTATLDKPIPAAIAPPSGGPCELCDDVVATLQCNECDQIFCSDCDGDMHKPVKMQSHKRTVIGTTPAPVPVAVPVPISHVATTLKPIVSAPVVVQPVAEQALQPPVVIHAPVIPQLPAQPAVIQQSVVPALPQQLSYPQSNQSIQPAQVYLATPQQQQQQQYNPYQQYNHVQFPPQQPISPPQFIPHNPQQSPYNSIPHNPLAAADLPHADISSVSTIVSEIRHKLNSIELKQTELNDVLSPKRTIRNYDNTINTTLNQSVLSNTLRQHDINHVNVNDTDTTPTPISINRNDTVQHSSTTNDTPHVDSSDTNQLLINKIDELIQSRLQLHTTHINSNSIDGNNTTINHLPTTTDSTHDEPIHRTQHNHRHRRSHSRSHTHGHHHNTHHSRPRTSVIDIDSSSEELHVIPQHTIHSDFKRLAQQSMILSPNKSNSIDHTNIINIARPVPPHHVQHGSRADILVLSDLDDTVLHNNKAPHKLKQTQTRTRPQSAQVNNNHIQSNNSKKNQTSRSKRVEAWVNPNQIDYTVDTIPHPSNTTELQTSYKHTASHHHTLSGIDTNAILQKYRAEADHQIQYKYQRQLKKQQQQQQQYNNNNNTIYYQTQPIQYPQSYVLSQPSSSYTQHQSYTAYQPSTPLSPQLQQHNHYSSTYRSTSLPNLHNTISYEPQSTYVQPITPHHPPTSHTRHNSYMMTSPTQQLYPPGPPGTPPIVQQPMQSQQYVIQPQYTTQQPPPSSYNTTQYHSAQAYQPLQPSLHYQQVYVQQPTYTTYMQ